MLPEYILIIGGFSLVVGLVCHFFFSKNKKLLAEMWAVDTYSARDLKRMVKGDFAATVEVQGSVHCENPVISLAGYVPCCYYHTSVEREDRRTRFVKSGGSLRTKTYYVWEKEIDETYSTLFKVRDKTGETSVDPTSASIDTKVVVDKIVDHRELWFGQRVRNSDTGKYRIKESVFKHEGFAYVLGQAFPTGVGDALIQYPKKGYMDPKKKFFIISRKSEKELTKKKQTLGKVLGTMRAVFFLAVLYSLLAYFDIVPGLIN